MTIIVLTEGMIECGINNEWQKRSLLFFSGFGLMWAVLKKQSCCVIVTL